MKNVAYHNVTSIELTGMPCYQSSNGQDFYSRNLIIKMADGTTERISMFSDNGYNLLIDDRELDSLQSNDLLSAPPLLKSA